MPKAPYLFFRQKNSVKQNSFVFWLKKRGALARRKTGVVRHFACRYAPIVGPLIGRQLGKLVASGRLFWGGRSAWAPRLPPRPPFWPFLSFLPAGLWSKRASCGPPSLVATCFRTSSNWPLVLCPYKQQGTRYRSCIFFLFFGPRCWLQTLPLRSGLVANRFRPFFF